MATKVARRIPATEVKTHFGRIVQEVAILTPRSGSAGLLRASSIACHRDKKPNCNCPTSRICGLLDRSMHCSTATFLCRPAAPLTPGCD